MKLFEPFLLFDIDESPSGGSSLLEPTDLEVEAVADEPVEDIDDVLDEPSDPDQDFSEREDEPWDEDRIDWDDNDYPADSYEPEPQAQPEQWQMNPREQAYYEAQALGRDADWAENRAFEIYEDRQTLNNLQSNAPLHVPILADHFEKSGIPAGAAQPYYENLIKLTRQGFRQAAQDPQAQRVALANAIGEYVMREHAAGRAPFASESPRRSPVTPTGGSGSRTGAGKLTRQDQRFVSQWQATHNGGKPPSSKQLAALQAEGLIG